jgi:hypothetical protein
MTVEVGHFANRIYLSQLGNLHLGGANLFDVNENAMPQQIAFTIAKGLTS